MRRPLCVAALVYCLAVLALLQIMPPETEDFSEYDRTTVTLQGTVVSKEYKTSDDGSVRLLITLRDCSADGWEQQPEHQVLCRVGDGTQEDAEAADELARIGGIVQIQGKLYAYSKATNAGEFDSGLYYQILGYTSFQLQSAQLIAYGTDGSVPDNILYRVKRFLAGVLEKSLEEEDAQILKAMLLGEKGSLSADIRDLYQSTGIIHILAISGLHISIIGMGLFRLLRKITIPLPVSAAISALVMLLYGRMTGMSASSFRAITMFLLRMLALVRHRTYDMLTAISLAGLLLLIQQPLYLYHTGFLFSFSAVLGIALLAPAFESKIMKTLSVTLGTLPVQLACYSTFPLYSVLLNLVVLPMMSTVMVSGLIVLALGSLFVPAGQAAGVIPHVILLFYKAICTAVSTLPGHQINVGAPYTWEIVVYLAILAAVVFSGEPLEQRLQTRWRQSEQEAGSVSRAAASGSAGRRPLAEWKSRLVTTVRRFVRRRRGLAGELIRILAVLAAVFVLCLRVHTGLSLHVIDVGQGDGILIRSSGTNILIDGGSTSKSDLAEYQLTPLLQYYGIQELDYVVITHPDADHMSGALEVIRQSRTHRTGALRFFLDDSENGILIGTLCLPSAAASSQNENYAELVAAAQEKNIPVVYLKEGDVMEGGRLRLVCLHPEEESDYDDANEMSVTLWLEYGAFTALLTGDLEGEGEERLLERVSEDGPFSLTLLKVAHHGSSGATSEEFLEVFRPQIAVVSCGVGNTYGHPHAATLERMSDAGVQAVYDTRTGGEIIFHTNGDRLRITQHGGELSE